MNVKTIIVDLANKFPHPLPVVSAEEVAALKGAYIPLTKLSHEEWQGCEQEDYVPTARQLPITQAVCVSLNYGLFYSSDVLARVIELMAIPDEVTSSRRERVEGGELGMDVYYARKFVERQATYAAERAAAAKMKLVPGLKIGTLRFNDGTRCTSMVINGISSEGWSYRLTGKRGKNEVTYQVSALSLMRSIDRAFEAKQRKDNCTMIWG